MRRCQRDLKVWFVDCNCAGHGKSEGESAYLISCVLRSAPASGPPALTLLYALPSQARLVAVHAPCYGRMHSFE